MDNQHTSRNGELMCIEICPGEKLRGNILTRHGGILPRDLHVTARCVFQTSTVHSSQSCMRSYMPTFSNRPISATGGPRVVANSQAPALEDDEPVSYVHLHWLRQESTPKQGSFLLLKTGVKQQTLLARGWYDALPTADTYY